MRISASLLPALLLAVSFIAPVASANDTFATITMGGIVFRKTDAIAMKKEVLNVGYTLITVDYDFVNESSADVEETIVFPLPPYGVVRSEGLTYYGQPDHFSIRVDGKPVSFTTVVRALLEKVDVTEQLRKLGLSDAQIIANPVLRGSPRLPPFTDQQQQAMLKLGLMAPVDKDHMAPTWEAQVNYVWKQKFPVNKVVQVHHEYSPFVGGGPESAEISDESIKTYCADAAFIKAHKNLPQTQAHYVNSVNVRYILTTGNSWKRGIEDFTLNINKRHPSELVSTCFPGTFKKIDARTYQVRLMNFRPRDDLQIYFGNVPMDSVGRDGIMPVLAK